MLSLHVNKYILNSIKLFLQLAIRGAEVLANIVLVLVVVVVFLSFYFYILDVPLYCTSYKMFIYTIDTINCFILHKYLATCFEHIVILKSKHVATYNII
jgi:hypothetical protein